MKQIFIKPNQSKLDIFFFNMSFQTILKILDALSQRTCYTDRVESKFFLGCHGYCTADNRPPALITTIGAHTAVSSFIMPWKIKQIDFSIFLYKH